MFSEINIKFLASSWAFDDNCYLVENERGFEEEAE